MIRMQDRIRVRSSPEHLFTWLEAMPQEYTRWHPDHVSCRLLRGSTLEVGAVAECKEYLHGKLHSMRFHVTRSDRPRRLDFRIAGLGEGSFELTPEGMETIFTAELGIGSRAALVGALVDAVLRRLFAGRLTAMRQHMKEEGENLKRIIESGWALPEATSA
jgi:hypothetical protein